MAIQHYERSSGAHIAATLAVDERHLLEAGVEQDAIAGLVGMAGITHFCCCPRDTPVLKRVFPTPTQQLAAQVPSRVDSDEPPMLLLHRADDQRVPLAATQRLRTPVRQAGGQVATRVYPWMGHIMLIGSLAPPPRWTSSVDEDIAHFVHGIE